MTTNITFPRGYSPLLEQSNLIVCRDFQKVLLYKLAEIQPILFAEAVAKAQSKTGIDTRKGPHFCLIEAVEEKGNNTIGQTISDPDFRFTDSMKFEINSTVQPSFLENHITVDVVIIRVKID